MNTITETETRKAAKEFAEFWKDKGYEKGQSQPFWMSLLHNVLGVEHVEQMITFEDQVKLDHTSFIDGRIPSTHVLIEQKSIDKDLDAPIKQSNGTLLTPFQQAKQYSMELPYSQRPRWIVTSNFASFRIYDMERPNDPPEVVLLENLENEVHRLRFLVDEGDTHIRRELELSIQAGEIVGRIYDYLRAQYIDPDSEESQHSLNVLCVRLVFLLYSENAGILGQYGVFGDYLRAHEKDARRALIDLFEVLDQPESDRDPYMDDDLAQFPYVNGGLFRDKVVIPKLTPEIVDLVLHKASEGFNWRDISPTIFGSIFESTLNPQTRREGGMHYTSIENIHKVIDPLFLDDLREELEKAQKLKTTDARQKNFNAFRDKLASLKFLDPACGSGNFLTETYLSLRRLENEAIRALSHDQIAWEATDPIRVSISQFYGIEINDFAATVAQTALWIAEGQMLQETEAILSMNIDYLPLTTAAHIVEGNALQMDWNDVVPAYEVNYIMGNPPFVGFTYMSQVQKQDIETIFPGVKNLDYVCAWYKKALDYIDPDTEVAFVSTNSITQGEIVGRFWQFMNGAIINFAYTTFVWNSETKNKAQVHVVIIGFSKTGRDEKKLYTAASYRTVQMINPYLVDGPQIIVTSRGKPLCDVPNMVYGNKPADGGNLIIEESAIDKFLQDPLAEKYLRPLVGAAEFLKGKKRWCLWLEGANPEDLARSPLLKERISGCKEMRENSIASAIRKFADTPHLFAQRTQPINEPWVLVPRVSSERRRYVPMAFMDKGIIATDRVQLVPNATLYDFGVLTSSVHMAWMRAITMRLKSDYSYSIDVVYNNFPWPNATPAQKAAIEKTAQVILDARALYPDATIASLYDEVTMPPELRKAHKANDRAVERAYGMLPGLSEAEIVAKLMRMYQKLTAKE